MVSWTKYILNKQSPLKELDQVKENRDYYKSLCDDLSESNIALNQRVSELEDKIKTMKQYKDKSFLDNVALITAKRIDDIFVRSFNGVGQRTATVQILLIELLNCGFTGSADGK